MTEHEYCDVTNLARLRAALGILAEVRFPQGSAERARLDRASEAIGSLTRDVERRVTPEPEG